MISSFGHFFGLFKVISCVRVCRACRDDARALAECKAYHRKKSQDAENQKRDDEVEQQTGANK
jgi:hypothetical protein